MSCNTLVSACFPRRVNQCVMCLFKNDIKGDNNYVPIPLRALPTIDIGETDSVSVKVISALFQVYNIQVTTTCTRSIILNSNILDNI